jgi:hypothetical protein
MKNFFLLALCFCSMAAIGQINTYNFNTGTLSQGIFILSCIGPSNPGELSDSFSTDGGKSFRASVSKGDALCGGSHRTEMNFSVLNFANVEWLYWENFIPPWTPNDPTTFSAGQIHAGTNVPFYIRFYNASADAVIQNSAFNNSTLTTNAIYPLGTFQKGVWHSWLVHFKRSAFSDGFIELWADGVYRFKYQGPTSDLIAGASELAWYAKFGLYDWNQDASPYSMKVAYTDNIKTGGASATAADFITVAPAPTPQPTSNEVSLPWQTY